MVEKTLTMMAVGDLVLQLPDPETYFEFTAPLLNSADVVIGFDVITLAGNHLWDSGPAGVEDTISGLENLGIAFTGAGMNIREARKPALVKRNDTVFGFLSYNCVGPRESWATEKKSGCAYVKILTHYELDHATPGGPPSIYTFAEPRTSGSTSGFCRSSRSIPNQ